MVTKMGHDLRNQSGLNFTDLWRQSIDHAISRTEKNISLQSSYLDLLKQKYFKLMSVMKMELWSLLELKWEPVHRPSPL